MLLLLLLLLKISTKERQSQTVRERKERKIMLSFFIRAFTIVHVAHGMTSPLKFHVAPMQAYTNQHLRYLYGKLNSSAWLWTEMEKTNDLLHSETAYRKRLSCVDRGTKNPCVLQLGGNNAADLRECVRLASEYHYDEINLNCGCPSIEAGGADYGAVLMKDADLTRNLLEEMNRESLNAQVSMKIRLAAHDNFIEDREESYDHLLNFVKKVIDPLSSADAPHIVVHARSAILSGLSTVKNRSIPPLKHDYVHELSRDLPHTRITLNGGISSIKQLYDAKNCCDTKIDGIMAGRWLLRRPLDLLDINHFMKNEYVNIGDFYNSRDENYEYILEKKISSIIEYGTYAKTQMQEGIYSKSDILSPLCLIAFQLREDTNAFEDGDCHLERESLEQLQDALYEAIVCTLEDNKDTKVDTKNNLRGIMKSMKHALGPKVFNKIKRNRNEL